ncbi:MAG: nitroreductase family protein [Chthonomonas sp.]|nr:nitroreductase family protein [Chthonomonas sp.]
MYHAIPYRSKPVSAEESEARMRAIYEEANERRTIRMFSSREVTRKTIELAIMTAGTAPSGAHLQPWHFVAISDIDTKQRIRETAEAEEKEFYERRITPEWREALLPLGTDFVKAHLTDAPWLIVVFRRDYDVLADGTRRKNYYMTESVGIAVGFLIQALHRAGLATLTHTPAPMTFLRDICGRPANEKPFVLLPVGYPADDCTVPDLARKSLDEICDFR